MRQASPVKAVVITLLVIVTLYVFAMPMMKGGGGRLDLGIALDSGLDKKGAATGYAAAPQYDSQYRSQSPAGESYEAADSNASSGSSIAAPEPLPTGSALDQIASWISPAAYAQDAKVDEKYLIRSGEISLAVEDFDASIEEVYEVADKLGGFVTDSDIRNSGDNVRSGWVTVRVPNTRFFEAFRQLSALGEVTTQTINSEDVSRQYVAAVSRLRNLVLEQDTLRQMLDEALAVQRSRGLGEGYKILLDTQSRLSDVTGEIQATEDQIAVFADKINNSTIRIELRQRTKYEAEAFSWGMGATFDAAKKELLGLFRAVGQALIHFFVVGWAYLLPWALLGWIGWRVYRRYFAPRTAASQAVGAEGQ